jgi:hypothetical protein
MTPPPHPHTHAQPHIPAQLAAKTLVGSMNERREAGSQAEENSANINPMSKNCYFYTKPEHCVSRFIYQLEYSWVEFKSSGRGGTVEVHTNI